LDDLLVYPSVWLREDLSESPRALTLVARSEELMVFLLDADLVQLSVYLTA
jgi:hypothetical protein